jgi:hypothetical protein
VSISLTPGKLSGVYGPHFGDRPAGLFKADHNKKPLGNLSGVRQTRLCPISLQLCKKCEFDATCKSFEIDIERCIEGIQTSEGAKREAKYEC